jgi:hypothetical protein
VWVLWHESQEKSRKYAGTLNIYMETHMPGEILEGNIQAWIDDQHLVGIARPYIWPGSWPDQDLEHMAHSLPNWIFDSAWIYYETWDPEIPAAVERFNQDQDRYHARVIHRDGVWHPPRDIIAVMDRTDSAQVMMSMWLGLGERS